MAGNYDVQETIDVINFFLPLSSAITEAKKNDGKIDASDLKLLLPLAPTVIPAFVGINKVPYELKEMDAEDIAKVEAAILAKMPSLGQKWVLVAQHSLEAAHAIYKVVKTVQG